MKKKVIVRGPALSRSGYGEHTRLVLRSLRTYEDYFDIYLFTVGWGATEWLSDDSEERKWIDSLVLKTAAYHQQKGQFDISIQVTIPNEWQQLAPVNIGVTAGIETTKIAPQWVEKSYLMDRIIVVSEHAKYGFDNTQYQAKDSNTGQQFMVKCEKPIHIVGYPVRLFDKKDIDLKLETDFNFLIIAQWGPRKNVENTIKWFVEEFKNDENVGLIVKATTKDNSIIDRDFTEKRIINVLKNCPKDRKCKVYFLWGALDESEMASLYQHPSVKAHVSIAHGEGFGLPIFESAYYGLPVVCPNWGGQIDFLHIPKMDKEAQKIKNKKMFASVDFDLKPVQPEAVWDGVLQADSMWTFAKEADYKFRLREVYKSYGRFKSQAKQLQEYLANNWTEEKKYKEMIEAILGEKVVKVTTQELPKVSIITSVFNGLEYLDEFFKDITRQTIFQEKCELILVHPKTSPRFEEEKRVIEKWQMFFKDNIVYKVLEEDPGLYGCWNEAVKLSTGEFITNANLDDRKAVNSLEVHAKELYLDNDVGLVYSDMAVTDKSNEIWEQNSSNGRRYNMPEYSFENLKMVNMPHAAPFWRKSLHEKCGLFESKYKSAGDWQMFLRFGASGVKMKKIGGVYNLYYFNPQGISTNPANDNWKREEEKEIYNSFKDVKVE